MDNDNYTERLEKVIKQMLKPLKGIPFSLVIESLTGKKVVPFDKNSQDHLDVLEKLKQAVIDAGNEINKFGIKSNRPNEVGNYVEPFVKASLDRLGLKPDTPSGKGGKKKSTGYPDILFYFKDEPYYLECKTYNLKNINTTQRSFYFSPSNDFKVIYDTLHFLISYEMFISNKSGEENVYKCKHFKILSIETLSLDVKYEFNSDNRRMYSGSHGCIVLAEGLVE